MTLTTSKYSPGKEHNHALTEDEITSNNRMLSEECMFKFKNSLQEVNWHAI